MPERLLCEAGGVPQDRGVASVLCVCGCERMRTVVRARRAESGRSAPGDQSAIEHQVPDTVNGRVRVERRPAGGVLSVTAICLYHCLAT
jgi:hypothetical protein